MEEIRKLEKKKMSKMKALNKYILTGKVKIILAFFTILTAVFYFFTSVNLAVSMFFAFVVTGIIYGMFSKELEERFLRLREENPSLFSRHCLLHYYLVSRRPAYPTFESS